VSECSYCGEAPCRSMARPDLPHKYNPANKFFLRRNGYYFRPCAKGYTGSHMEAGLFSQEVAEDYVQKCEGVSMHHAPI